jgi:lysophospholipase L1-like esterase
MNLHRSRPSVPSRPNVARIRRSWLTRLTLVSLTPFGCCAAEALSAEVHISRPSVVLRQDPVSPSTEAADNYRLQPNDRLTLVGGTLIERLQFDGQLEAALYQAVGESGLQIRNLGWSGDDVWGTARAVFGQPSDGFERLESDLKLTQPSVVVLAYGANESFAGAAGLEKFQAGLARMVDMTEALGAKPLLLTPPPFENLGPPLPDMAQANTDLASYCDAIRGLAAERGLPLIDLHSMMLQQPPAVSPRTENGIHLSATGTTEVSRLLAGALLGRELTDTQWDRVASATELRSMILQKNEWFFHRYRPQNETYLFLFRKHEQGNNAAEIPQFDPLIAEVEQQIRRQATSSQR